MSVPPKAIYRCTAIPIKMLLLLLSHINHVRLCATPETAAHQVPHPWDSPGKNTGVGCHFLLQCMKVKSETEVIQSCWTLSDPMDCSPPGSSIHGIFQAGVLELGTIAFSAFLPSIAELAKHNIPRIIEIVINIQDYIISWEQANL